MAPPVLFTLHETLVVKLLELLKYTNHYFLIIVLHVLVGSPTKKTSVQNQTVDQFLTH